MPEKSFRRIPGRHFYARGWPYAWRLLTTLAGFAGMLGVRHGGLSSIRALGNAGAFCYLDLRPAARTLRIHAETWWQAARNRMNDLFQWSIDVRRFCAAGTPDWEDTSAARFSRTVRFEEWNRFELGIPPAV
jgi:hypothetical protein